MKKFYPFFLLFIITVLGGCVEEDSSQDVDLVKEETSTTFTATISSPKSPAIFPIILVAHEQEGAELIKWETSDTLLTQIQNEEAQFFILPLNIGANLYAKGMPIQLLQVNTWGSMFLVSTNGTIHDLQDLAGKTIFVPSQGGPPDILTNYYLNQDNIKNVTLSFVNLSEIGQQIASGTIENVVLPEPMLSILQANVPLELHTVLDFNEAWEEHFDQSLPQAGVFVKQEWAANHKQSIEQFQSLSEDAITNLQQNNEAAIPLISKYFDSTEQIINNALANSSLHFHTAQQSKEEIEAYFNLLIDVAPESIGGVLPDENFYYTQ
ncbi:NitT/TauT family transport system substrate-binding protein [Bacillus pakistanensis]|uniref:NitT/TauT family transport system substrate-binding protein n=1 Tax=Rossellomorea pakistanensis TaxID=992288 RepID=A0ABS2NBW5_9BACI|nr:MqnA/MqnD/SBP family protein [Bacillus pakistanensis]MBM7585352.1 NitT/TauT family transport system substrate-binding protein [Bacillus pakistanensis]